MLSGIAVNIVLYAVDTIQTSALSLPSESITSIKSPQLLKTISSIAKSLPHPPTPLLIIFKITAVCPGKV